MALGSFNRGYSFGDGSYLLCLGGGDCSQLTLTCYGCEFDMYFFTVQGILKVLVGNLGAAISVEKITGTINATATVTNVPATDTHSQYWKVYIKFNTTQHRAIALAGTGTCHNLIAGAVWQR